MAGERVASLTPDEIEAVLDDLRQSGHGPDGDDYESECPTCTAADKLKAALSFGVPLPDGAQR